MATETINYRCGHTCYDILQYRKGSKRYTAIATNVPLNDCHHCIQSRAPRG